MYSYSPEDKKNKSAAITLVVVEITLQQKLLLIIYIETYCFDMIYEAEIILFRYVTQIFDLEKNAISCSTIVLYI